MRHLLSVDYALECQATEQNTENRLNTALNGIFFIDKCVNNLLNYHQLTPQNNHLVITTLDTPN